MEQMKKCTIKRVWVCVGEGQMLMWKRKSSGKSSVTRESDAQKAAFPNLATLTLGRWKEVDRLASPLRGGGKESSVGFLPGSCSRHPKTARRLCYIHTPSIQPPAPTRVQPRRE